MILPALISLRKRWYAVLLVLAGAGALYALAGFGDVGAVYGSFADFDKRHRARDFVIVGRFGKLAWPAVVIASESGLGGVQFSTPNGQSHIYQNFEGRMKALTLASGISAGARFVIVLREGVGPTAGVRPSARRYLR